LQRPEVNAISYEVDDKTTTECMRRMYSNSGESANPLNDVSHLVGFELNCNGGEVTDGEAVEGIFSDEAKAVRDAGY